MPKLRILLVDDHAMLRDGLVMLIHGQPELEVVAQAANGRDAIRYGVDLRPDIAVLDVSLPDMSGAEIAEQLRACCPDIKVLALTRHSDQAYLRRLLQAGAAGYVLKKSAGDTLIHAIRIVASGGSYIEPELMSPLLQRTFSSTGMPKKVSSKEALSNREEEVLQAIAWGRSNKEIATTLALSIKTVESYKAAALDKLRLRTRADIVRYAVTRGWLSEEQAPE